MKMRHPRMRLNCGSLVRDHNIYFISLEIQRRDDIGEPGEQRPLGIRRKQEVCITSY